jgi:hypothetical protein
MFGLHRGTFTLSLDFELIWGSRDLVADPRALLAASRTTRDEVFEPLLELFTQLGLTATWATVGHLFLEGVDKSSTPLHPSLLHPHHTRVNGDWLDGVPAGDEESHPK